MDTAARAIQNRLFIDGEFVDGDERGLIPVLNPHDNSLITEVAEARKATSIARSRRRVAHSRRGRNWLPRTADCCC